MEHRMQATRPAGLALGGQKTSVLPPLRSLLSAALLGQRNNRDESQKGAKGVIVPFLHSKDRSARASHICAALLSQRSLSAASPSVAAPSPDLGFHRNIESKYQWGKELGKGGNGCVRVVADKETGAEYACKVISKVPAATASAGKKEGHLDSIAREIEVLSRLKGSLNAVELLDVFEDDGNVYIVQEWCRGGELWHAVGSRHYSERTVASYMRAVLRTLAQCHAKNILHRDIKPGNFMLLNDDERSPLKAIDFGLATSFDPENPVRTDLGLEGTPWFMAPETLRSEWQPASDIWAAGVMAFQLLTGRFPFDDHKNPSSPSISAIWKSVLCDDLAFKPALWEGISDEARSFVAMLLTRDPAARPSAKDALKHPWLQGNSKERSQGKRLSASIVQSIQRYASNSVLKRTVLQSIAAELLTQSSSSSSEKEVVGDVCALAPPVPAAPANLDMLYSALDLCTRDTVDTASLAQALESMGFKLEPSEVVRLVGQLEVSNGGEDGEVDRAALLASQMDWRSLQRNHTEEWLGLARKAFQNLDADRDGVLDVDELISALRGALPADEVNAALRASLAEAGTSASAGIDFEQFLSMLRVGSLDSLDIYDDAMSRGSLGSIDRLNSLLQASDWSMHGDTSMRSAAGVGPNSLYALAPASPAQPVQPLVPAAPAVTAFRFDVGPSAAAAMPPAPAANTVFRFDVAEPAALHSGSMPGGKSDAAAMAAGQQARSLQQAPGGAHAEAGRGSPLALARDGSPERRLHGGNLYRVAVLDK